MVRAIIDIDDTLYDLLRQVADREGRTVESHILAVAAKTVHEQPIQERAEASKLKTWDDWFAYADSLNHPAVDWKWNREELYDRQVLR